MHALFLVLALGAREPAAPHAVGGTVTDSAGASIADARLILVELGRTTNTGVEGRFSFPGVNPGTYRLSVSAIGYAPVIERVTVGEADVTLHVALKRSLVELPAAQVTASASATTPMTSPQPTSVLGGEALRQAQAPRSARRSSTLPGVRTWSTGRDRQARHPRPALRPGAGRRGRAASRESAVGRRARAQVEAAEVERIEVIRGPASVLYGSDALGGVVKVVPAAAGRVRPRRLSAGGRSAAYAPTTAAGRHAAAGGCERRLGFRGAFTGRASDDSETPEGPLFNSGGRRRDGSGTVG